MQFSSGDLIAIGLGSVGIIRWLTEAFFKQSNSVEDDINELRLDFEREKAANGQIVKTTFESLKRLERGLGNIQAQFRTLVTGGASKTLVIKEED